MGNGTMVFLNKSILFSYFYFILFFWWSKCRCRVRMALGLDHTPRSFGDSGPQSLTKQLPVSCQHQSKWNNA